ncbi:MAG TPA: acyl carrier protein [Chloroflexi bacterium]|jgi:acyl carrier protein|nr:acyl carrier protein [Chloroflexota bacterium]HBY45266.1 acyl carrier protein [Chloroflexota bacterium]HCG29622.1 acyl carrier protein [Chloroflexota bacterium]
MPRLLAAAGSTLQWEVVALSATFDKLQAIVAEQLGVDLEKVTPDAEFVQDLNADSLDLVELIMSLEEEFGVEISDEDAEKIVKVSDAMEFIQDHDGA